MNNNLYLIEILLQEVTFKGRDVDYFDIKVDVQLGTLADLTIQLDKDAKTVDRKYAKPGSSYLFPCCPYVLKSQMTDTEVIFKLKCAVGIDKIIGEVSMKWPKSFKQVTEKSFKKNVKIPPATVEECLPFSQGCGHMKVFMRFTAFDGKIKTDYQVVQTPDKALSYLFKGADIPIPYTSPEYGTGEQKDLLAIGPIYSQRDTKKVPSDYSLDLTISQIEANLCGEEDCLAAYQFKKYGIGPLAKTKPTFVSPCGGETCEYGYTLNEPPCIGYRKCQRQLPDIIKKRPVKVKPPIIEESFHPPVEVDNENYIVQPCPPPVCTDPCPGYGNPPGKCPRSTCTICPSAPPPCIAEDDTKSRVYCKSYDPSVRIPSCARPGYDYPSRNADTCKICVCAPPSILEDLATSGVYCNSYESSKNTPCAKGQDGSIGEDLGSVYCNSYEPLKDPPCDRPQTCDCNDQKTCSPKSSHFVFSSVVSGLPKNSLKTECVSTPSSRGAKSLEEDPCSLFDGTVRSSQSPKYTRSTNGSRASKSSKTLGRKSGGSSGPLNGSGLNRNQNASGRPKSNSIGFGIKLPKSSLRTSQKNCGGKICSATRDALAEKSLNTLSSGRSDLSSKGGCISFRKAVAISADGHLRGGGGADYIYNPSGDYPKYSYHVENPITPEVFKSSNIFTDPSDGLIYEPYFHPEWIVCEDCKGYSLSGKTCKDLRAEGLFQNVSKKSVGFVSTEIDAKACKSAKSIQACRSRPETALAQCENQEKCCSCQSSKPSTPGAQLTSDLKSNQAWDNDEKSVGTPPIRQKLERLKSGGTTPPSGKTLSGPVDTEMSDTSLSQKLKRKKTCLVYNIGDKYPGHHIGHKRCIDKIELCHWKSGWAWKPEPLIGKLKPRKEYRPGFIAKEVQEMINEAREINGLPVVAKNVIKKKKKRGGRMVFGAASSVATDDDESNDYDVEDKQTLQFSKKEGSYMISMSPLRNPKDVKDNEDPYINCPPINFKLTPDPFKMALKQEGGCECCKCDEEDESEDELNLEFSPPRGVIELEKMKKAPNVVHFWTQYDGTDFGCPPASKQSSRGKKKRKGKKGKGKGKR